MNVKDKQKTQDGKKQRTSNRRQEFEDKSDFMISKQWRRFIEEITDKQAHIFIIGLYDIHSDGHLGSETKREIESDSFLSMMFRTMVSDYVTIQRTKYQRICEINRSNRVKGNESEGSTSTEDPMTNSANGDER